MNNGFKALALLFLFSLVIPGAIPSATAATDGLPEQQSQRQRVYLSIEKLSAIKTNLNAQPYLKFWNAVKDKANKFVSDRPPITTSGIDEANLWKLGDGLPDLALSYLITGNKLYLEAAQKWMDALSSYPDWASNTDIGASNLLFSMAVAYDWLHDDLSEQQRTLYGQKLAKHAAIFYDRLVKKDIWWVRPEYLMQNHNYQNVMAMALAGLVLQNENPQANQWLVAAANNFDNALELLSPDGASHEGVGYWGAGLDALLKYYLALPLQQGVTKIEHHPFFRNTATFRLYASLPGWVDNVDYADSPRSEWKGPGHMLRILASIFKDGHAQWLADRIDKARNKDAKNSWLDLIGYDLGVTALPPNDLPNYKFFDNLGIFITRSDWSDNATWAFFKAGPSQGKLAESKGIYTGSHIHPDEGSFLLWANGGWRIIDDGYVFKKRTENHNVLTFNGKGQLGEGKQWFDLQPPQQQRATAHMLFTDFQPNYQYLVAELADLYPRDAGVKSWQRSFIALSHGQLIIRDKIEWQIAGRTTSRIHLAEMPEQVSLHSACIGTVKKGLQLQAWHTEESLLKSGRFVVDTSEHTRSTNLDGGVIEFEHDGSRPAVLVFDSSGGCGGQKMEPELSPSGETLQLRGDQETTTIDFAQRTVDMTPK